MACNCSERKRPFAVDLPAGSNERPRAWLVLRRNETCSAFNGYRRQWSRYSNVMCQVCGQYWRTEAKWVGKLRDCTDWPERHPPRLEPVEEINQN